MYAPEGCGCETVEDTAVDLLLIDAVIVVQAELGDDLGPEDDWKPLSEGDMLQLRRNQPPRLLVHQLVQLPRVTHLHRKFLILLLLDIFDMP